MGRFIWGWSSDGTVIHIYEVIPPRRFHPYHQLKQIKSFYTIDYADTLEVATDFIERLKEATV